jgi:transposase-like protein
MVGTDPVRVDGLLAAGQLRCPDCSGQLRPWGHARSRAVRDERKVVRHRPRRSCCSGCGRTHVLLAASVLARRADGVAVIGTALLAKAEGLGHRTIAAEVGRPASTVRGWLRRFGRRAEALRVLFTGLLHALDPAAGSPLPTGSSVSDALAAVGAAAAAAVRLFGPRGPWQFAAAASGGLLLGPCQLVRPVSNTS